DVAAEARREERARARVQSIRQQDVPRRGAPLEPDESLLGHQRIEQRARRLEIVTVHIHPDLWVNRRPVKYSGQYFAHRHAPSISERRRAGGIGTLARSTTPEEGSAMVGPSRKTQRDRSTAPAGSARPAGARRGSPK